MERLWNLYKMNRSIQWANHYDLFNILHHKKYGQEIYRLSHKENRIRILLYTNYLPLNAFQHYYESPRIIAIM